MTISAIAMAPGARAWLANTKSAWVLNVFDRTCNLVNTAGAVLSLVSTGRGLTPFGLLLPANSPPFSTLVSVASPVRVEPGSLRVGPLAIAFASAPAWNPTPDWDALRELFAQPGSLAGVAVEATRLPSRGSLLELLGGLGEGGLRGPMGTQIASGAEALVDGLRRRSTKRAIEGALRLAGVGGGLTPAGDDFMVGALLAAWAGLYGSGLGPLPESVAAAAALRTTTLSGAYLRAAGRGECSAPWHALFEALLGDKPSRLQAALQALLAIGHTSGGDGLAGFLATHWLPAAQSLPVTA